MTDFERRTGSHPLNLYGGLRLTRGPRRVRKSPEALLIAMVVAIPAMQRVTARLLLSV